MSIAKKSPESWIQQEIKSCEHRMKHPKKYSCRNPLAKEVLYLEYNFLKKLLDLYHNDEERFKVVYRDIVPVPFTIWPEMRRKAAASASNCRTLKITELTEKELAKARKIIRQKIDEFLSKEL